MLYGTQIRPIDKKLDYQVQKLTRAANNALPNKAASDVGKDDSQDAGDPLKYRPNPDMLVSKIDQDAQVNRFFRYLFTSCGSVSI